MNAYARSADTYLTQRILSANPEQQAALIMEAGQLHLGRAIQSLKQSDHVAATRSFLRVLEAIAEATIRLNLDQEVELAQNLKRLYEHWTLEVMAGSKTQDSNRLAAVAQGMGEIRQAWEQFNASKTRTDGPAASQFGDQLA
jgi:flagellar biosynthetic protein FliS